MRILTAESMRQVDRSAIDDIGIPGMVLMENAAIGLAEAVGELYPEAEAVAIFCGPGNNGGDGLALARHLDGRGYRVEVFLAFAGKEPSEDCAAQLSICERQGISSTSLEEEEGDIPEAAAVAAGADLVVDALFGTGLGRPLEGFFAALVECLNDLPAPILAVDLPSGLTGSRAEILGPHIEADATVTFAAPKVAHVFPPTSDAVGELVVTDLGIPPFLVDEVEEAGGRLHLVTPQDLAGILPRRDPRSHKGTFGHVLVVAGSSGKAGAAVLATRAAVRGGAGLVTVAVPEPLLATVDGASLESMTLPLAAGPSGEIAAAAVEVMLAAAEGKTVVALGPGLGQGEETAEAIRDAVARCPLPLVLDADGLNAFAGRLDELAEREVATVLTPHPGELGRLLGTSASEVQGDRLGAARRAARESRAVVVLKGSPTLVAVPGEGDGGADGIENGTKGGAAPDSHAEDPAVWVSVAGNPGMASGGSGDVLTGLIAALWAQLAARRGRDHSTPSDRLATAADAARLGVWLHGRSGDLAADRIGEVTLAAVDLIDGLGAAFLELEGE